MDGNAMYCHSVIFLMILGMPWRTLPPIRCSDAVPLHFSQGLININKMKFMLGRGLVQ